MRSPLSVSVKQLLEIPDSRFSREKRQNTAALAGYLPSAVLQPCLTGGFVPGGCSCIHRRAVQQRVLLIVSSLHQATQQAGLVERQGRALRVRPQMRAVPPGRDAPRGPEPTLKMPRTCRPRMWLYQPRMPGLPQLISLQTPVARLDL